MHPAQPPHPHPHHHPHPPAIPHKTIFVLIDGLGDVNIEAVRRRRRARHQAGNPNGEGAEAEAEAAADQRGGLTPLQAAHTPTLDIIARHGLCGLLDSVGGGLACGSDTAHLSLLGYDPLLVYRGRGAFESMGSGLDMSVGDVAFKSNFATIIPHADTSGNTTQSLGVVSKRRCDRAFHSWGVPLCDFLDGLTLPSFPDIHVSVRYATEHRCGVRLRGRGLSDCITGTDPLVDGRELRVCKPTQDTPAARRTSAIVNELSHVIHQRLSSHPLIKERAAKGLPIANIVLFRGAGARIDVPSFESKHELSGKACMVAPTAIIAGLGKSLGFDLLKAPGATGDYRTDLRSKARVVAEALIDAQSKYSFAFLHVKAVDDAGHDRDIERKIEFIERCDDMINELIRMLRDGVIDGTPSLAALPSSSSSPARFTAANTLYTLIITGDHSTPVVYGDHSCEPVPVVVSCLQHLPGFETHSNGNASTAASPTVPSPYFSSSFLHYSPALHSLLTSPHSLALRALCTSDNPVATFDEMSCSRGLLGRFPGSQLLTTVRKFERALLGMNDIAANQQNARTTRPYNSTTPHCQSAPQAASTVPAPISSSSQLQLHPVLRPFFTPSLTFSPTIRAGVSPWMEDTQNSLDRFSPPSSTPLPSSTSIVIIGAGFTGLSTALSLAKRGHRPLILERGHIGSGATGRNGGHVHPINSNEVENFNRFLEELREAGIDPERDLEYRQRGSILLDHAASKVDPLLPSEPQPNSASFYSPLPQDDFRTLMHTSSPLFPAARFNPHGGSIHPLRMLVALALILRDRHGIHVRQQTKVLRIEKIQAANAHVTASPSSPSSHTRSDAPLWRVHTSRGSVECQAVIHATNAWVSELVPLLSKFVTPVRNHVIQTTPPAIGVAVAPSKQTDHASTAVQASPSSTASSSHAPHAHPPASSISSPWSGLSIAFHHGFDYLIQRPGGSIVLGGGRYIAPDMDVQLQRNYNQTSRSDDATEYDPETSLPYVHQSLASFLPRAFPDAFSPAASSSSPSISHAWTGTLGFTSSGDPLVGAIPDQESDGQCQCMGQFVAVGFSGHGMPRCRAAGEQLAIMVHQFMQTGCVSEQHVVRLNKLEAVLIPTKPNEQLLVATGWNAEQLNLLHAMHSAADLAVTGPCVAGRGPRKSSIAADGAAQPLHSSTLSLSTSNTATSTPSTSSFNHDASAVARL